MTEELTNGTSGVPILIVDDSRTQVELLRYLLELQHYDVTVAANGQEAIEKARQARPSVIISDIVMPVMDGYEMCHAIKTDSVLSQIPVILLTQLSDPEDIVRGLKARADYYLTKPYKPDYLLGKVKAVLEAPPPRQAGSDPEDGLEVFLAGKSYIVTADRQQMLNLLFSTYENAVQQNRELVAAQQELKRLNEQLQEQQDQLQEANQRLHELATLDGLTGLKNHRAFKERLEEEMHRAARYQSPLSLLLLDVDRFKSYNDSYGHPAGDEVLRGVGRILIHQVRESDFPARYGGEEFAVLLPSTNYVAALVLAERVRSAIEREPWPERSVTASFGVSMIVPEPRAGGGSYLSEQEQLIDTADRAMYHSKTAGRNCVTHARDLNLDVAEQQREPS